MRLKHPAAVLAAIALLAFCSLAWAEEDMPEKLDAEFTQYPGSTVAGTVKSPTVVQAVLKCGSATVQQVFDYYKKQVVKNGWKIRTESKAEDVWLLTVGKPGENGNIAVGADEDGKTGAALTIMKGKSGKN